MFKTMKQGFGWAVGYILGLAAMKIVADGLTGNWKKNITKPEETK